MKAKRLLACVLSAQLSVLAGLPAQAQAQAPAQDPGWPRELTVERARLVYYEPQVDAWKNFRELDFRLAFELTPADGKPAVGIAKIHARTDVDVDTRNAVIRNLDVVETRFPAAQPEEQKRLDALFRRFVASRGDIPIALDRLVALADKPQAAPKGVAVRNDPPAIFVAYQPAVLLQTDGKPVTARTAKGDVEFIVNANWPVLRPPGDGSYYLFDDVLWLSAARLEGPWQPAGQLPGALTQALDDPQWADLKKVSSKAPAKPKVVPAVFFSSVPAEVIVVTEKTWGPDYLRSGVFVEATDKETEFALRAAYHRKWVNALGAEWLTGFQLGERSSLYTEFYQPLEARQRWFVEPAIGISRDRLNIYEDNERIAEYLIRQQRAFFNLGANIGVLGALRVGYLYRKLDASVETGAPRLPTGENTRKGWQAILEFDQFNRAFFPSSGWYARLAYYDAQDEDYSRLSADLRLARSWDPYVVNARFGYLGSPRGRLPLADAGGLGGFLSLSGYVRDQILAGDIRFASVRGERVIGRMPLGLSGDLRIGVSLEAGRARDRLTETRLEGWQQAAALYLGGETPFGPLYLGYGYAKGGRNSLYLFLGLP